jgi:thioredoxin 1
MIQIENKEHLEQILSENSAVVMDFYADWCGPCKQLLPVLEKVSNEEKQKDIVFCKINVDQNEDLSKSYSIRSIPALKYVKNNEVIKTTLGVQPVKVIMDCLDEIR